MFNLNVILSAFLFLFVGCSKQYVGVKKIDKIPVDPSYSGEKVVNHLLEGNTSDEDFVEIMNNVEYQFNRKDFWFHARNKLVIDEPWIYKIFKFRPVCEKGDGSDLIETSSYFADYLVKQTNFFFSTNNIDVTKILRNLDNISYVFKECEIKNRNDVFLLFSQDEWGKFFSNITSDKFTKSLNKNQYERYFDFMLTVLSLKVEDLKLVESKDSSILVLRDLFSKFPWDLVHEKLISCKSSDSSCADNYSIVRMKDHDIPRVFYREYFDADSDGYEGRNSLLNRKDMLLKFLLYIDDSEIEVAYEKLFNYIPDTNRSGIVLDFLQQSVLSLSSGQQAFTFALLNDSFKDQHPKEVYELGLKVFNNINGTSSLNESVSIMNFLKEIGNKEVVNCSDSNSLKLYQDTLNNISSSSALPFSAEDKNIIESLVSLAMDLKIRCKELVDFPSEAVLKVVLEKGVVNQDLKDLIRDGVFNQQADIILAAMLPEDFNLETFIEHLGIFSKVLEGNDLNALLVKHVTSGKNRFDFTELIGKEEKFNDTEISFMKILTELSKTTFDLTTEAGRKTLDSYDLFLASYMNKHGVDLELFSTHYPLPNSAKAVKLSSYKWNSKLLKRILLNPLLIKLFKVKDITESINETILLNEHREKYVVALGHLLNYTDSDDNFLSKLINLKDEGHMTFLALIMKNALIISNNTISHKSSLPELDKHIVGIVLGNVSDHPTDGDIKKGDQEWMTPGKGERTVTSITRNECVEQNTDKTACIKWNATRTRDLETYFKYGNYKLDTVVKRTVDNVTVTPADQLSLVPEFVITYTEESKKNRVLARKEKLSVVGIYYPFLKDIAHYNLLKFSGYTIIFMQNTSLKQCKSELQDTIKSELRNFSRCFNSKNEYFKSAANEVGLVLEIPEIANSEQCAIKNGVKSYCVEEDNGELVLKVLNHNISFFEVLKLPTTDTHVRVDKSSFNGVEPMAFNKNGELIKFFE